MPRIRFTSDPKLPRDLAHLGYRKDAVAELSVDQCERWVRRGVAVYFTEAPKLVEPAAAPAPVAPPAADLPTAVSLPTQAPRQPVRRA